MADAEIEASASGLNIGAAINEKLSEQIQNMDVMSVLKKMIATAPVDEESQEVKDKLTGIFEQYNRMSDDQKAEFTSKIKDGLISKISAKLSDPKAIYFDGLEDAIQSAVMQQIYLAGLVVLVVFFLIVFFGYKLYKSLKEKEKKKEEKKKAKQMKKKK